MEPDKNGLLPGTVFCQHPFVFSMMAWPLLENMGDFQRWNDIIKTKSAFGDGRNHALNCLQLARSSDINLRTL
jgi:hypothetical protein